MQLRFHTVAAKDRVERYIAVVLDLKVRHVVSLLTEFKLVFRIELDKYGVEVGLDLKKFPDSPRLISHDAVRAAMEKSYSLLSDSLKQSYVAFWSAVTMQASPQRSRAV